MKIFHYSILIIIIASGFSAAQVIWPDSLAEGSITADSIEIRGNETTEEFIIRRELTFKKGDAVSDKILNYNRERIYSLGIFNFVDINLERSWGKNIIVISVKESWYIFPVPFMIVQGEGYKKASYGLEYTQKNFRGRNETLNIRFAVGYDPFFGASYYNPVINYDLDLNFTASFFIQNYNNKSPEAALLNGSNFKYRIMSSTFMLGKRLNQFNDIYIAGGLQYIEAPEGFAPEIMASGEKVERFGMAALMYVYDTRDLKQFPDNGIYAKAEFVTKGIWNDAVGYSIINSDFRAYKKLMPKITARWRFAFRNLIGAVIPYYEYSLLGISNFIRGHSTDERAGHNMILTSLETSYTVLEEYKIELNVPPIPKELTSSRLSIRFNIFYDTGLTYQNRKDVFGQNWDTGLGAGLTFLFLPYNAVRLEVAVNEDHQKEFILGAGFAF